MTDAPFEIRLEDDAIPEDVRAHCEAVARRLGFTVGSCRVTFSLADGRFRRLNVTAELSAKDVREFDRQRRPA